MVFEIRGFDFRTLMEETVYGEFNSSIKEFLQLFWKQFPFMYPVFLTLASCSFHYTLIMVRDPFEHGASDVYLVILWFIGAIVGASTAFLLDILLEKKICGNVSGWIKKRRVKLLLFFATILSLVSGCILAFERSIISARCLSGFIYGFLFLSTVLDASEIVDVNIRRVRCYIIHMAMSTALLIGSIVIVCTNSYFEECFGGLGMVCAFVGFCGSFSKNSNSNITTLPDQNKINITQNFVRRGINKVCWITVVIVERFFYAISISVPLIVQSNTFITHTVIHDKDEIIQFFVVPFVIEICEIISALLFGKHWLISPEIAFAILRIVTTILLIAVAYFLLYKMIPFAVILYQILCGMSVGMFSGIYLTEAYPSGKKKLSIFIIFTIEMLAHTVMNLMVNFGEFFITYFRYQILIGGLISSTIRIIPAFSAESAFIRYVFETEGLSANECSTEMVEEFSSNESSTEMDEELSSKESSTEMDEDEDEIDEYHSINKEFL